MPVRFDEYESTPEEIDWALDHDSNAYQILSFLAERPDTGFSPAEIHRATGVARGSVGTTLSRLDDRGLVRHKEPYWAVDRAELDTVRTILRSIHTVEESTTFKWGNADPERYRIGLAAVSEDGDGRD